MRHCSVCRGKYPDSVLVCTRDGSPTLATPVPRDPLIGRQVGSYKVTELLGQGGMGAVYAAEHPTIGSRVAVKFLHAPLIQDVSLVERFFNEAKASNIIGHENIVQTVDYLFLDGTTPCLVMEFLDQGYLLTELTGRPQPLSVVGPILLQACDALAAAHARGIVHRDLKPDNIYLTVRNRKKHFVKLMDFGIAKLNAGNPGNTHTGTVMGTPWFMSPEQALGRVNEIGPASDVYSLGIIMYQLATGAPPFDGGFAAVVAAHMSREPAPPRNVVPDLPPAYEQLILKCLAKRPADRFPSARELGDALAQTMQALSIPAELPPADAEATYMRTPRPSEAWASSTPGSIGEEATRASASTPSSGWSDPGRSVSNTQLTARLRADHMRLIEILNSLRGRAVVDDDARQRLTELKEALIAHTAIEDERLFPVLHEAAEQDPKIRSVLSILARDMAEISEYIDGFFERCFALGPADSDELDSEVETLVTVLMGRLWKEENSFFAEYDKIKGRTDPNEVLQRLKEAHKFFADLFERARACGDTQQTREMLFAAREPLVAHIELEDREFYPLLRKQAETDAKLRSTLSIFARDMDDISLYALGFFERCAGDDLSDEDLAAECERLSTILMARLWKEENILFPEYKKLAKGGKKRTLVEELRDDHRALFDSLEKLKNVDLASPKGRETALAVKRAVLDHFQKEEKAFYPILRRIAETDPALQQTLDLFDADLEALSNEILEAFETASGEGDVAFARAHGALTTLMKLRVRREEQVLFAKLPALAGSAPASKAVA